MAQPNMQRHQREGMVNVLRKSFGEAPDSPTLGYYRDLPDPVLTEVTDQSTKMNGRMMVEGVLSYGAVLVTAGSMVADAKQMAAVFGLAAVGLAVDAARTYKRQENLRQAIFDFVAR